MTRASDAFSVQHRTAAGRPVTRTAGTLFVLGTALLSLNVVAAGAQVPMAAVEEMRTGESNGVQFTAITWLTVDRRGALYVVQPSDARVVVLDGSGRIARAVGHRGAGPGEFSHPVRMGWVADTLWVYDAGARRVSLFSFDGRFITTFTGIVDLGEFPLRPSVPNAVLASGESLVVPDFARGPMDKPYRLSALPVVTATRTGKPRDTITVLNVAHADLRIVLDAKSKRQLVGTQPFSDAPLWAVSPQGDFVVFVDRAVSLPVPHVFAVRRYSVRERRGTAREIAFDAVPFTQAERESFVDREVKALVQRSHGSLEAAKLWQSFNSALFVPPIHVPIEQVVVDWDGRVWLARMRVSGQAGRRWLVLDEHNRPLWDVVLPAEVRVWTAQGNKLWASGENEAGTSYIVRYRLATATAR